MENELIMLGGAEEIGANSCYLSLHGLGIIIDAGMHPKKRDADALPHNELIADRVTDYIFLTHAHIDHLGGLPYTMKFFPHTKIFSTRPTRDLTEIMLKDSVKLLHKEVGSEFPQDALSLYTKEVVDNLSLVIEGVPYRHPLVLESRQGKKLTASFHYAGHIIGSAGILFEADGKTLFHTGDVQFNDQAVIPKAKFPRHHLDTLIIESTNGASDTMSSFKAEKARLAKFINKISNQNGSVLLPTFALGKTQEILRVLYELMRAGKIPHMPIYSGGMARKISLVYDRYCYTEPMLNPGFEVSDIEQQDIDYENLLNSKFFSEPSIVVATSGMLNVGSTSWRLALEWMRFGNFGIGFVGYQDEDAPGYALQHSPHKKEFEMAGRKFTRKCAVESFRFSAHAGRDKILEYIFEVKPKELFLIHGDEDACYTLAGCVKEQLPQTNIFVPKLGKPYKLEF